MTGSGKSRHLSTRIYRYLEICNSIIQWISYISRMHGAAYAPLLYSYQRYFSLWTLQWVANLTAHHFRKFCQYHKCLHKGGGEPWQWLGKNTWGSYTSTWAQIKCSCAWNILKSSQNQWMTTTANKLPTMAQCLLIKGHHSCFKAIQALVYAWHASESSPSESRPVFTFVSG